MIATTWPTPRVAGDGMAIRRRRLPSPERGTALFLVPALALIVISLAGIAVDRVKIIIFTAQGVMAAFAGIVLASRITSGQPNTSQGFELEVISACVLGGVSLTGGVGSMAFVIAGVLIMGIVQNAMNLLNVATFYQYVARGVILLGAVMLDRLKQRT